jgi:nicotinamide mononucleotide transporter
MQTITPTEWVAVIFSLISVLLTIRKNIWCWPVGMIGIGGYFVLMLTNKLYADMTLQVIFFVQSIIGWYYWNKVTDQKIHITHMTQYDWRISIIILIGGSISIGYLLHTHTDGTSPYVDATASVGSIIATWLLSKKRLENWWFWLFVDFIYIWLFLYKSLYASSILYAMFFGFAYWGYRSWKKEIHI